MTKNDFQKASPHVAFEHLLGVSDMKKINLYGAAFVVGSSTSLILSVVCRLAPEATEGVLPLGQDDFLQAAIITFPLLAVAAVIDFFRAD